MDNPLLKDFEFTQPWLSVFALSNLILFLSCIGIIIYLALRRPESFARPSSIISILAIILYQLPLVLFSPLIYNYLPNARWFALSINFAVISNLLWVAVTPNLNMKFASYNKEINELRADFSGPIFWLPILLLCTLLVSYFYKIPFDCTALYALFVDQDLTLLVREITGKLMGRTYAPHVLNMITGAVGPIVAFLAAGRLYISFLEKKWAHILLWLCLLLLTIIIPLLGGAKGAFVPMGVVMVITGALIARNWKERVFIVGSVIIVLMSMIMVVKVAQESKVGKGNYRFSACVMRLGVCDRTEVLLNSLKLPKDYYGMSRERIDQLEQEIESDCKITAIEAQEPGQVQNINNSQYAEKTIATHIKGLFYRILANPLQVASWHYLYVSEYGKPGLAGLALAKIFTDNYVSIPAKVCEVYYSGDKTSACTAPTGYFFTYPAYLGIVGLLSAFLLTVAFDIIGALVIKYLPYNFSSLAIGLMAVASLNFMVADFTTVIISHGAGMAIWLLAALCLYHRSKRSR